MATIGQSFPTLLDMVKAEDPDGKIAPLVEMMAKQNDMLKDAIYVKCNDGTKHDTTIRTGIPEPTFRKYNQGVQPSKSTRTAVTDTTGMLADYLEVDKDLADKSGNAEAYRASEAKGILQGFNNKVSRYMAYGDTDAEPEAFLGLSPRFNDTTAGNGGQIIKGDGAGVDNTSIWFVTWGEDTCHLLYPDGQSAGFHHEFLGEDTATDANGGRYQIYRDYFKWHLGMSVRDWRGVSRIPNIDISNLTKDAAAGSDLIDLMIDAYYCLDQPGLGFDSIDDPGVDRRTVIYCNKTIASFLHKQAMNGKNVNLTIENYGGKPVTTFLGHAIRRVDSLLNTEEAIS